MSPASPYRTPAPRRPQAPADDAEPPAALVVLVLLLVAGLIAGEEEAAGWWRPGSRRSPTGRLSARPRRPRSRRTRPSNAPDGRRYGQRSGCHVDEGPLAPLARMAAHGRRRREHRDQGRQRAERGKRVSHGGLPCRLGASGRPRVVHGRTQGIRASAAETVHAAITICDPRDPIVWPGPRPRSSCVSFRMGGRPTRCPSVVRVQGSSAAWRSTS
jgi:hypothetical protein